MLVLLFGLFDPSVECLLGIGVKVAFLLRLPSRLLLLLLLLLSLDGSLLFDDLIFFYHDELLEDVVNGWIAVRHHPSKNIVGLDLDLLLSMTVHSSTQPPPFPHYHTP